MTKDINKYKCPTAYFFNDIIAFMKHFIDVSPHEYLASPIFNGLFVSNTKNIELPKELVFDYTVTYRDFIYELEKESGYTDNKGPSIISALWEFANSFTFNNDTYEFGEEKSMASLTIGSKNCQVLGSVFTEFLNKESLRLNSDRYIYITYWALLSVFLSKRLSKAHVDLDNYIGRLSMFFNYDIVNMPSELMNKAFLAFNECLEFILKYSDLLMTKFLIENVLSVKDDLSHLKRFTLELNKVIDSEVLKKYTDLTMEFDILTMEFGNFVIDYQYATRKNLTGCWFLK
jgi:hypothetical protein